MTTSVFATPTALVSQSMEFSDDINFENIDLAISRQLLSYETTGLSGVIKYGARSYAKTYLRESLILFKEIVDEAKTCQLAQEASACMNVFNQRMNAEFDIFRPIPGKTERGYGQGKLTTQFTSYYSPDLIGSPIKTERFSRAIYGMPEVADRSFTREQIDFKGALEGKGYELFYVEDSFFDLYLLHVQGGGRIKVIFPDGSEKYEYLSYAGSNAKSFQMIYKYMVEKGYLKPEDAGINGQRKYLEEHPEKQQEIFASSPSYIYFKVTEDEPVGLNNIPLTEMRSLAMDSRIYKDIGLINFVKTNKTISIDENQKPVKAPFSRFMFFQDTGGAIRGNARVDLYSGYGPDAVMMAYNTNDLGQQYFLIKKKAKKTKR